MLGSKGAIRDAVLGTIAAGPTADTWDDPRWTKFSADYKKAFPDGFPAPSLFAHAYYINTKAALLALDKVGGDLSDGGKKFREALAGLSFDTPTGMVKLDHNRNAIADIFVTEVVDDNGTLRNKVIKIAQGVDQTLGEPEAEFLKIGPATRDNPSCE